METKKDQTNFTGPIMAISTIAILFVLGIGIYLWLSDYYA
jgi:hypothetical protein